MGVTVSVTASVQQGGATAWAQTRQWRVLCSHPSTATFSQVPPTATAATCPRGQIPGVGKRQKIRGLDQGHKWDKVEETLKRGWGQPTHSHVFLLHTQSLEWPARIQISSNFSTRKWRRSQSLKWESPIQEWCYHYLFGRRRERIKLVPFLDGNFSSEYIFQY